MERVVLTGCEMTWIVLHVAVVDWLLQGSSCIGIDEQHTKEKEWK